MAKIKIENTEDVIDLPDGSSLAECLEEAGVPFACTEGVCGTCVIEIKEGAENLSKPTQEEEDFLGSDCEEERLGCQCKIEKGDVTVSY